MIQPIAGAFLCDEVSIVAQLLENRHHRPPGNPVLPGDVARGWKSRAWLQTPALNGSPQFIGQPASPVKRCRRGRNGISRALTRFGIFHPKWSNLLSQYGPCDYTNQKLH